VAQLHVNFGGVGEGGGTAVAPRDHTSRRLAFAESSRPTGVTGGPVSCR